MPTYDRIKHVIQFSGFVFGEYSGTGSYRPSPTLRASIGLPYGTVYGVRQREERGEAEHRRRGGMTTSQTGLG